MIFTQEAMMSIYCKTVKKKTECKMPASMTTDDNFYASYLGLTFAILCLVIHIVLTFIYTRAKKNYITCFISGAYLPITIGAVFKVIHIMMSISYPGEHRIGIGFDIVSHAYTVSLTAGVFSVFLGAIVLLFITVFTNCNKREYATSDAYSIFYSIQMFGWLISSIIHFCYLDYRPLPLFTACFVIGLAFVVFIVALLCGLISICATKKSSKKVITDDVVAVETSSTNSLLIILYTILVIVPPGFFLYSFEQEFELVSGYDYDEDKAVAYYYTFRIMEYFSGPFITLLVLLLPPIYSGFAVLTSSCAKKGKKEGRVPLLGKPQKIQPITMADEIPAKIPIISEPSSLVATAPPQHDLQAANPMMAIPGTVPVNENATFIPIPPNCTATVVYTSPITFKT